MKGRSSVEAEYRAMAHAACELMWLKNLLTEIRVKVQMPMEMHCDNQVFQSL